MRNSASEYNQITRPGISVLCVLLSLLPFNLSAQQEFTISSEDMVAIRADQAWEDIEPDTAHFAGHFEMRVRDLQLTADRATLYGRLEDPERLVLGGSPVRIHLSHTLSDRTETIQAEAREIVYERDPALLRLSGSASLAQGDNELHSESIEYDIKTNRFRSEGRAGVQIKVPPQR